MTFFAAAPYAHLAGASGAKRSGAPGFTLLELMVVVALISIITAVFAPGLSGTGVRISLRTNAQAVGAAMAGARELAVATGKCSMVGVDSADASNVLVYLVEGLGCEGIAAPAAGALTMSGATVTAVPALRVALPSNEGITAAGVGPVGSVLVWRPNGHLRGEAAEYGAGTAYSAGDNRFVMTITTARVPAGAGNSVLVVATEAGMVCLTDSGGCP